MRLTGLMWGMLALATTVHAAPPIEPVETTLEAVDVAGRELIADGMTWALSSTAVIVVPGNARASLRDLAPGMHVRLDLVATDDRAPVVRTVTVRPD